MKRLLVIFAVLSAIAVMATAQSVVGTKHDLSTAGGTDEVCVYCHTPHQDALAIGQDPLWNHQLQLTASYGVYDSATRDFVPTDIGTFPAGPPQDASVSFLCMSCHDGTVAPSDLYNDPNAGAPAAIANLVAPASLGTDLSDDHPINMDYVDGVDAGMNAPFSVDFVDAGMTIPLFGNSGSVQCASCHNVHDDQIVPFLRVSNLNSALCTTCHIK